MRGDRRAWRASSGTNAALALATAAVFVAGHADAFCRTTTEPSRLNLGGDGGTDASTGCTAEGLPLYQPSQCLPYRLLATESPVIPNAVLSEMLARAFATWTAPNPTCTPGISGIELPPIAVPEIVHYGVGEENWNIIGVVSRDWPYDDANSTLALTTVTFSAETETGEILDADLELYPSGAWSFDTPSPGEVDLQGALTHEVGHMLGLADSPVLDATMFARSGSTEQRTLAPDDEQAICTVYPNRGQRLTATGLVPSTACNLAPGSAPGAGRCPDPLITHGCSSTPPSPSGTGVLGLALATTLAATLVRRRRSR